MKRVIFIKDELNNNKYVLIDEYNGHCIYQHKTPSGYFTHQDYAITKDDTTIRIESYNNICKEELYDAIDNYIESGKYGFKVFKRNGISIVHSAGNITI